MNGIGKSTKKINVVCTVVACALVLLIFALEIWQFNMYLNKYPVKKGEWGEGLLILAVIILCVFAAIPLGVGGLLQLISTVGVYKSQTKARGFLIVGIVGKFFTAVTLLLFSGLLLYTEIYGIITKALYVALAIGYLVIAAWQIKLVKQLK